MLVRISQKSIHHFKDDVLDGSGQPTGSKVDVLRFDLQFPEYPNLPTYGMSLPLPTDKATVKAAIKQKALDIQAQMDRDQAIRQHLGSEILEFNI